MPGATSVPQAAHAPDVAVVAQQVSVTDPRGELQDAVLHAKTAVIDGAVSSVGSANLDRCSFTHNNEIEAGVIGEDFGESMRRMFAQDLNAPRQITLQDWHSRSLWQRSKEVFARIFERLW